jgi:plasmid stabilization system protein ParE
MTIEVVVTALAVADLQNIGEWLLQHNPDAALATVRMLRERCEGLALAPRQGRGLPVARGSGRSSQGAI